MTQETITPGTRAAKPWRCNMDRYHLLKLQECTAKGPAYGSDIYIRTGIQPMEWGRLGYVEDDFQSDRFVVKYKATQKLSEALNQPQPETVNA
jgi:hypothetical protein